MPASFTPSTGPPNESWTSLNDYDGSGNQTYAGLARSFQPTFTFASATISKAAAGSVGYTAHGMTSGQSVTISGASGDWAALNGTQQIVTVTGVNAFTIPVNTSGYSGSFDGVVTTNAPRTNATCWSISQNYYSGTSLTRNAWCNSTTSPIYAWDSRTTYAFA